MVAMNDLIVYRRNRWFMGVLRSPMTRRLTLSHLLVVLLPAAVAFWLLQLHLDNRDVKRAQLTAEALLLAHVVEGRLPHRARWILCKRMAWILKEFSKPSLCAMALR